MVEWRGSLFLYVSWSSRLDSPFHRLRFSYRGAVINWHRITTEHHIVLISLVQKASELYELYIRWHNRDWGGCD